MNVLMRPIPTDEHEELIVLSLELRTYASLSSKGGRFHLLQPAVAADPRVGDGKRLAGELVCTCEAGLMGRLCWATKFAEAFEAGEIGRKPELRTAVPIPDEDLAWLQAPSPELQEATTP